MSDYFIKISRSVTGVLLHSTFNPNLQQNYSSLKYNVWIKLAYLSMVHLHHLYLWRHYFMFIVAFHFSVHYIFCSYFMKIRSDSFFVHRLREKIKTILLQSLFRWNIMSIGCNETFCVCIYTSIRIYDTSHCFEVLCNVYLQV